MAFRSSGWGDDSRPFLLVTSTADKNRQSPLSPLEKCQDSKQWGLIGPCIHKKSIIPLFFFSKQFTDERKSEIMKQTLRSALKQEVSLNKKFTDKNRF